MTAILADDGRDFLVESLAAGRASAMTWRTEADGLDAELNIIETALLGDVETAAPAPSAQTVLVTYEVGACARHDLGATIAMDPTLLPDPRGYHLSPGVGGSLGQRARSAPFTTSM